MKTHLLKTGSNLIHGALVAVNVSILINEAVKAYE
jgi:hypothetical protein